MTFDKDFKDAIKNLPSIQKDKLILRLLKHDLILLNQLYFELVDTKTVDQRRQEMSKRISKATERMTNQFYSVGYLLSDLRYLSGDINEHVKITKDKIGEISLNIQMLNEVLTQNNSRILTAIPADTQKLCTYIIARAFKILLLIKSLHEDYLLEFRQDLKNLGELISDNSRLMKTAIENGFDVNWILKGEIPENITTIHKELRANGFLK